MPSAGSHPEQQAAREGAALHSPGAGQRPGATGLLQTRRVCGSGSSPREPAGQGLQSANLGLGLRVCRADSGGRRGAESETTGKGIGKGGTGDKRERQGGRRARATGGRDSMAPRALPPGESKQPDLPTSAGEEPSGCLLLRSRPGI